LARRLLIAAPVLLAALALLLWPAAGQAQDPVLPAATPDGFPGLELFAGRCANCHGETGAGDGELILQAGNQPPMPFDAAYIQQAMPSVMFDQITNGEAAVGMPPFGPASSNPIDDAGRWNLVAAVYSLATSPENVAAGQEVYAANCAACHGDAGQGDGPDAATTDPAAGPLTDVAYWFNRSNDTVVADLAPGVVPAHAYDLPATDLQRVVDFARTFSYVYADPAVLNEPIAAGTITGVLTNGSSGQALANTAVTLRAFTAELEETLTLTTTTGTDGAFQFDVTDTPPGWVYIVNAAYDGLSFNSGADQLSRTRTALDMPVTVFDKTTDATAISIAQLHVVMEFAEDLIQVSQLYIFSNAAQAVYVGPTGNPAEGVVEVAVPEGAQNLTFQRSFGAMDSFLAANDFVATARGWADPLPLRPGETSLTLLVRYALPYVDGLTITHPVFYNTASGAIILPDNGVDVVGADWVEGAPQTFGEGEVFRNFGRAGLAAGDALTIQLEGRPSVINDATTGQAVANRDTTSELLIGGGALLLAAVGGIFLWRYWQGRQEESAYEEAPAYAAPAAAPGLGQRDDLLRRIAALDDAFENGRLQEADYRAQREELKQQLAAVWGR
ncbi:MAG TPA: c-type cytochrome, partial [Promineifilum sp.]|nr:c-type cytochrome [Promineifilum sp.]